MHRIPLALLCALIPALAAAQQQQMFRYVDKDGRVVYTDTAPPADARSVQQKTLGGNYIETSEPPYALQIAQQRNPVTLYAGPCGPACDQGRNILNRRGVPFREIDPSQPGEGAKLKMVTGEMQVPVLVIGSTYLLKGFEEEKWQGALDQAGYPKTPAPRITQLKREAAEKSAAAAAKGAVKLETKDAKALPKADAPAAAATEPKK
jgi:glutaredoxin